MDSRDLFGLSSVAITDNHCHGLVKDVAGGDLQRFRSFFTETNDEETAHEVARDSIYYKRLIKRLSQFWGIEPNEGQVLAKRQELGHDAVIRDIFGSAHIGSLVVDQGYPAPSETFDMDLFSNLTGSSLGKLLRLELMFQDVVAENTDVKSCISAIRANLENLRDKGYVGLKSIAAYRSGLDITTWDATEVDQAFGQARRKLEEHGHFRIDQKPLIDTFLYAAFEEASKQQLPVQFHVGYGDRDVDLRRASPLLLRSVLEEKDFRSMPVVLLHGSWPYFREAAYLSIMYPNVYFDLSFGIPFLSMLEMRSVATSVLSTASTSKIMYSSDGVHVPEIFWLSALDVREILTGVFKDMVDLGEISVDEGSEIGRRILSGTALKLYGV